MIIFLAVTVTAGLGTVTRGALDGHVGLWQGCLDLKIVTVTRDWDDEGELEGVQDQPEELDVVATAGHCHGPSDHGDHFNIFATATVD
jgi:hypothetical protein